MRAVCDAGPLIHLSWLDQLHLLARLSDEVVVPEAVRDEILAAPEGTLGLDRIRIALTESWLRVVPVSRSARAEISAPNALHQGEVEAILLAQQIGADIFLSDDARAGEEARGLGLPVAGTVGLLSLARDSQLIPGVLPLLKELRSYGQWISDALMELAGQEDVGRR